MGSSFGTGGLVSGMDTDSMVRQLMALERKPIERIDNRINAAEKQEEAIGGLRENLQSLQSQAGDLRTQDLLNQFDASSSEESVVKAEVGSDTPAEGTYDIEVLQLANPTLATSSAKMGAAIDPNANLEDNGMRSEVTQGQFGINGETFDVDPTQHSLQDVLDLINNSDAGVTASYDTATDKVTIANTDGGNTYINFHGSQDDVQPASNFIEAINIGGATAEDDGTITSTQTLGAVDYSETLADVGFADGDQVTAGAFEINGIGITVDPQTDSLQDVLDRINSSDAGVMASYDSIGDQIRVDALTAGANEISFVSGSSNFLDMVNLSDAEQDLGQNAEFTVNGETQSRNTNTVTDAIGGVELNLRNAGTSTLTVERDEEATVEAVRDFVGAFNDVSGELRDLTGREGALSNDSTIRQTESMMRNILFDTVGEAGGELETLLQLGVSTGRDSSLQFDEDTFLEALRSNSSGVQALFSNADNTGIADRLENYLDGVAGRRGMLDNRTSPSGSIAQRISSLNDQKTRVEDRLEQKEARLRKEFLEMERMMLSFQKQGAALNNLGGGFSQF
ncbi:MAG: flagellar filament capping protein FliD [Candidatus Hydrogenedentota bacterium]